MKKTRFRKHLKILIAVLTIAFSSFIEIKAQSCSTYTVIPASGSTTVNGVTISTTSSGDIMNAPSYYSQPKVPCLPRGTSPVMGTGHLLVGSTSPSSSNGSPDPSNAWSITLNFNYPVNNVVFSISHAEMYENFRFTSNGGTISIANNSCYMNVSGNTIVGDGQYPYNVPNVMGGIVRISAPSAFTQLTINGNGGYNGSLIILCGASVQTVCKSGTTAPPKQNLNVCPSATVNLNTAHTGTIPTGASLRWFTNNAHTGSPLTAAQVAAAGAGTYYAFYYDSANTACYSPASLPVTVATTPNRTVTSNATRTTCINTALSPNITHTTTGVTGIGTPTGLPAGLTANFASNTITISGTPTVSGTFDYTIPLTGGCGTVNATGRIIVNDCFTFVCPPEPYAAQQSWWLPYRWSVPSGGSGVRIDFQTGTAVLNNPVAGTFGQGNTVAFEGNTAVTNPATGELLFVTDGNKVYRGTDGLVATGSLVGGNDSAGEAAGSIPDPNGVLGRDFLIFGNSASNTPGGLNVAKYNLQTNVVSDVTPLLSGVSINEALEVIPHTNGSDYWILVHTVDQNVKSYLYSKASGFNATPVSITSVPDLAGVDPSYVSLQAFISWDPRNPGKVLITRHNKVGLASFNPSTGVLGTWDVKVTVSTGAPNTDTRTGYSAALSANGNYIYYVPGGTNVVRYHNISTGVDYSVGTVATSGSGLKIAKDGRLYVVGYPGSDTALYYFSTPDAPPTSNQTALLPVFDTGGRSVALQLPNNVYWGCVTCQSGTVAPALANATIASNPATVGGLIALLSASNQPAGTVITIHSGTPATDANKLANSTAIVSGNTYYAAFYDGLAFCYSPATAVAVQNPCTISATNPDSDGDGISDLCDLDDDNDGILDTAECSIDLLAAYAEDKNFASVDTGISGSTADNTKFLTIRPSDFGFTTPGAKNVSGTRDYSSFYGMPNGSVIVEVQHANVHPLANEFYTTALTSATTVKVSGTVGQFITFSHGLDYYRTQERGFQFSEATMNGLVPYNIQPTGGNWISGNTGNYYFVRHTASSTQPAPFFLINTNSQVIAKEVIISTDNTEPSEYSTYFIAILPECDTDKDGIPNRLDLDSDADGCSDVLEGGASISEYQLVTAEGIVNGGSTTVNQNLCATATCVSTTGSNIGLPQLSLTLPSGYSNTTGQSVGNSQNILLNDCHCYESPTDLTAIVPVNHGITALSRAGADNGNWPMLRNSAYTALESKTKGFVITRTASPETAIAIPVVGMMVFDTDEDEGRGCLKIYTGSGAGEGWKCFTTQGCPLPPR